MDKIVIVLRKHVHVYNNLCLCNCMYAAHFMEKLGHKLNMHILL